MGGAAYERVDPAARPLVGRRGETQVLERALAEARRGRPSVVHLSGLPGLGKSRLIAQTCATAAVQGATVLHSSAAERDAGRLFGAVADPFEHYLSVVPESAGGSRGGAGPELGRLAAIGLADPEGGAEPGAREVGRLLREVLTDLAASRPVLLAVDDVHWADEGSVDVLASLSRRPPHAAVTVLLGYRPQPRVAALHGLPPGRVEGTASATRQRIELGPLDDDDVALLLPDTPAARRRSLLESSAGNPFYLLALHHAQQQPTSTADDGSRLPAAVHAALRAEIDACDPCQRQVVEAAAVVGDPFAAELVGAVADVPVGEVLAALDALRDRDLCQPTVDGRWCFRHSLVRRVAYDAQSSSARVEHHRRAAVQLARTGATPAQRARHVLVAARPGDVAAAELLLDAADGVAGQAPGLAEQWYAGALAVLPDGGSRGTAGVQLARAQALTSVGQLNRTRDLVHDLLALLPVGDSRRAAASRIAARVEHLMGRNSESAAMLTRELAATGRGSPRVRAELELELATTRLLGGSFAEARLAARRARRLGTTSDHLLAAYAGGVIALGAAVSGDVRSGLEECAKAAAALDGLSDSELAASLEAGTWLGWAELFLERLADSIRHLERCLTIARRGAHQHVLAHLLIGYGSALKTVGRLGEAAEVFDEAAEAAAPTASPELETMTVTMQCRAATWLGDLRRARTLGARAVRAAQGRENWFASVAVATLAQARLAAGHPQGCVQAIFDAGGGIELESFDPASRCDWWEVATRAALLEGQHELAADLAARSARCAASVELSAPAANARLASAEVLLARGDGAAAATDAERAAELFARAGYELDRARAQLVQGRAAALAGERGAALAVLHEAQTTFATCGARRLLAEARFELRRLGLRLPTAAAERAAAERAEAGDPAAGPLAVLSPRERQVAALVALGQTNRQIAAELVVSEKTVESHLGHIFTKLGLSSRAGLAALAPPPD
ncbi:helix-turn-helix transcriptional regulator [Angustibacter sp. McL0619]|uniref:helix-turn-helix transcriptional regulator n=1 Tax=Angustibacter sp. McL0619 TaxID=3415676 RepID=UPI003CE9DB32